MAERVVVAIRSRRAHLSGANTDAHLADTRRLTERATALGGRVVAWSAGLVAYDFALDAIEDAVELVIPSGDAPLGAASAGIAQGDLEPVLEVVEGSTVAISWGPALLRAEALARVAREGEALVDPSVDAVRSGALLTRGARLGRLGDARVRGLLIDLAHTWRPRPAEALAHLVEPALVARGDLIAEMMVRAGTVGLVRADRGAGGTRFLRELSLSLEHARVLFVAARPFGEPLGCLRRALDRDRALARGPIVLPGGAADALERLLEGRGLSIDAASSLLSAWLAPESGSAASGAVLVDDVNEVDADSLQAIARGALVGSAPFRVVARLGVRDQLPDALERIPEGPEVRLGPLPSGAAEELASAMLGGTLAQAVAARWGRRGGGLPLAINVALAQSLESGELMVEKGDARPRERVGGRGRPQPARYFIQRRVEQLDPAARAVVTALAVLGGEAEVTDVEELVRLAADFPVDLDDEQAEFESRRWVVRALPNLVALPSTTHRDVLVDALSPSRLADWHRAASRVLEASAKPLAAAAAAAYAARSGDLGRAGRLAGAAARAAREAGLDQTASLLAAACELPESEDIARRLSESIYPSASAFPGARPPSMRPSVMPPEGFGSGVRRRSSYPPPKLPSAPPGGVPRAPRLPGKDIVDLAERVPPPRMRSEPIPTLHDSDISEVSPSDSAAAAPVDVEIAAAVEALRGGDPSEVEQLAARLRLESRSEALAERLEAMATLARGETLGALRQLRQAADRAKKAGGKNLCRATLAHAVALAAAGRPREALLEALAALARAKENDDHRGEEACRRLLARLSESAGAEAAARTWTGTSG